MRWVCNKKRTIDKSSNGIMFIETCEMKIIFTSFKARHCLFAIYCSLFFLNWMKCLLSLCAMLSYQYLFIFFLSENVDRRMQILRLQFKKKKITIKIDFHQKGIFSFFISWAIVSHVNSILYFNCLLPKWI